MKNDVQLKRCTHRFEASRSFGGSGRVKSLKHRQSTRPFHRTTMMSSSAPPPSSSLSADSFTNLAWEAVQKLPALADGAGQQTVEAELLLKALLLQGKSGMACRLLSKSGVDVDALEMALDKFIEKLPKVETKTENKILGSTLQRVLATAKAVGSYLNYQANGV